MQNLVVIDAQCSGFNNVQAFIFCEFGCLFMPPFGFFWGQFAVPPKKTKRGMNRHPNSHNIKAWTKTCFCWDMTVLNGEHILEQKDIIQCINRQN